MFTGIVEEKGKVRYIQLTGESGILAVKARKVLEGTRIGDSIAVNGVCLTVTSIQPDGFNCRCDGRDDQKKQSWQLQGRKPGKPGTCNGCRRQVRGTHSKRPY